jgi:hypothetical protein
MARLVLGTLLSAVAVVGVMPQAVGQIPPVDEVADPIEEATEQVEKIAGQTVGDGHETVEQTGGAGGDTVEDTADGSSDAVQKTTSAVTDEAGSAPGSMSEAVGDLSGGIVKRTAQPSAGAAGGSPRGFVSLRPLRGSHSLEAAAVSARTTRVAAESGKVSWSEGAVYVPLSVRLTNDADGDGHYSDVEAAPDPDRDVPFQVQLENVGWDELAILAIRDASPTPLRNDGGCLDLAGIRLAPGQSTTCRFRVSRFAPREGERIVAVFEVDAVDTSDPSSAGTVVDTTAIKTEASVLGTFIRRGLDALASTGAQILFLLAGAVGLAVAGGLMLLLGNRQKPNRMSPSWARLTQDLVGDRPGSRTMNNARSRRSGGRNGGSITDYHHASGIPGSMRRVHRPAKPTRPEGRGRRSRLSALPRRPHKR